MYKVLLLNKLNLTETETEIILFEGKLLSVVFLIDTYRK